MVKSIQGVAVAAAALSPAGIVGAQGTGDSASGASRVLEEIIVTAQRREESLQDAAVAVDAVVRTASSKRARRKGQFATYSHSILALEKCAGQLEPMFEKGYRCRS